MAIRTLLKFRNLDLTKDINDRYTRLFTPGVFDGGNVVPVTGQLKVEIEAPWKIISKDGMVIEETSDNVRLATPTGQTSVIAVKAIYAENDVPIIEVSVIELSAFEMLSDKDYYVVFAYVIVPSDATLILDSYIHYTYRDTIDKLGRSNPRGVIKNYSLLPDAKDNIAGDLYVVSDGIGGIPHIYGWDGYSWVVLTDAATVTANLATHRANLYPNEKHATDAEKLALVGTSGIAPSASNPFVDNADTRIPTQDENDALTGTDGNPAAYNRYITEEYPWAIPEEIAVPDSSHSSPALTDLVTVLYIIDGPVYIGSVGTPVEKVASYFKLYDSTKNREYTTSVNHPTKPSEVVNLIGVFFDAACTQAVDPIIDADLDGFLKQPYRDLYLAWDIVPDTAFRILYAKKELMKKIGSPQHHPFTDAFIRRRAVDAQIPADVIKTIEDIKGRDYDVVPPLVEQNINLRRNLVDTKEYISSYFKADSVVKDFKSVEGVPAFKNDFSDNMGIPQVFSFENITLSSIGYSYDLTLDEGTVSFTDITVDLSLVTINEDVFIDGSLTEYKVIAVDNVSLPKTIKIKKRSGKTPRFIDTNLSLFGTLTLDSTVVTNVSPNTNGLTTNMVIKGNPFIPTGTVIVSIDSLNQITLSNAATTSIISTAFVAVPDTQQSNFYMCGSIKKDNNPRKINLAALDYLIGRNKILCRTIQMVPDEYHPVTGDVAFEVATPVHSITRKEPRVRFYGGFQNRESGKRSRVVNSGNGTIMITGFFTDLFLISDLREPSSSLFVSIDGSAVSPVAVPIFADLGNELDLQQQYLLIASGLTDAEPHTVELYVVHNTTDFIVYGFDLLRDSLSNVLTLSGRAFVQTDLYKKNAVTTVPVPINGFDRCRGTVSTRYINRQLTENVQTTVLFDMDGPDDTTCPKGSVGNNPNFGPSTGLAKFSYYQVGDVVKLVMFDTSPIPQPIIEQVMMVDSITGSTAIFTTSVDTQGPPNTRTAILTHMASTVGDVYNKVKEFNRYMFVDLGVQQGDDFSYLLQSGAISNKLFTVEDGTTSIVGNFVRYLSTGVAGADVALNMANALSVLRIRAVACQLDILVANYGTVSADIAIDGSPYVTRSIVSTGLTKYTIWSNARYQSHEVVITNAAGLNIVGFIVSEPDHDVKIEGNLLATQNIVASYDPSESIDDSIMSTGVIAVDPYILGGVFVDQFVGSWSSPLVVNFSLNPYWGRYTNTTTQFSYFEYTLIGGGFEIGYLALNDRMIAQIYVDNTQATALNFGSASFKGIDSSTGQVDMYDASALPLRRKFGMTGLTSGIHTVKVMCTNLTNPSSTGAGGINVCTVYEINSDGYLSYTPSKGVTGKTGLNDFQFGMDWARDERVFDVVPKVDAGSVSKVNSQEFVSQDIRTGKVLLTNISTTIVDFVNPFTDSDYSISCNVVSSAGTPSVISTTITNMLKTRFTVYYDTLPISGDDYYLIYTATKYF